MMSRHCCLMSLLLTTLLAGCSGGDVKEQKAAAKVAPPKVPKAGDGPKESAAKPTVFAVRELAKVLDVGAFPTLEGTHFITKSPGAINAEVPGTMLDVADFYQSKLLALGWENVPTPDRKPTEQYAAFNFNKDGHFAALSVSKMDLAPEKGPLTFVTFTFYGNLDTRTLPNPGVKPIYADQTTTTFHTDKSIAVQAAATTQMLKAAGWQSFTKFDAVEKADPKNLDLKFRKQGYLLTVYIGNAPTQKGKTHLQYSVSTLAHELPAPLDATKVEFDDARWKLRCEVPSRLKATAAFYEKAMRDAGYTALPDEEPRPTFINLSFGTDTDDVILVQLSSMDGRTTSVTMNGVPAAVAAKLKQQAK